MEQNSYLNLMPAHHLSMSSPAGTTKFKPLPTPRPHDNRRFLSLRPSHVFHFMTMSYYPKSGPKRKMCRNRGSINTHMSKSQRKNETIFPKLAKHVLLAEHLIY